MVLSKGSLYCPERLFHDIFLLYFWYAFFAQYRSKKCRGKSFSWKILLFESHESTQAFKIITHNSLLLDVSFLLEVISRSQLPQNSEILYRCFGRRLLQDRHESDWNITLCVVLVRPYSVQELPSLNCMRHYLFVAAKSQAWSKSLEKSRNSFEPPCFGFFSVDSEYVRQYQQFGNLFVSQTFWTRTCSKSAFQRLM